VENTDSFTDILNGCFDAGGVHLVEAPIDYSENKRVLIDELERLTCMI